MSWSSKQNSRFQLRSQLSLKRERFPFEFGIKKREEEEDSVVSAMSRRILLNASDRPVIQIYKIVLQVVLVHKSTNDTHIFGCVYCGDSSEKRPCVQTRQWECDRWALVGKFASSAKDKQPFRTRAAKFRGEARAAETVSLAGARAESSVTKSQDREA